MKKNNYWIGGIVIIFVAANPTYNDFLDYLPSKSKVESEDRIKLHNFLIASTYSDNSQYYGQSYSQHKDYLGILGNFFEIDSN